MRTTGKRMSPKDAESLGAAIRETMIEQLLDGLRHNPATLSRAEEMAKLTPDPYAEVLKRYREENSLP